LTHRFGQIENSNDRLHSMVPDGGDLSDGTLGEAALQCASQPVDPVHGLQRSVCGRLLSCACNIQNPKSRTAVFESSNSTSKADVRNHNFKFGHFTQMSAENALSAVAIVAALLQIHCEN
jgi:hypothetical protein